MERRRHRPSELRAFATREQALAAALSDRGHRDPRLRPNGTRADLWNAALEAGIVRPAEVAAARAFFGRDNWDDAGD